MTATRPSASAIRNSDPRTASPTGCSICGTAYAAATSFVPRSIASSVEYAALIEREIEAAAQLHHPHILPLYDSGEADGFLFCVTPYEEGRSLHGRLLWEGELPVAVRVLCDVADALSHASHWARRPTWCPFCSSAV